MTASPLSDVFARQRLAMLADPGAIIRGAGYAGEGRVEGLTVGWSEASAVVRGTVPYRIVLRFDGDEPDWSCDCPAAEDGAFCKHCVAVALELQAAPGQGGIDALFEEGDSDGEGSADDELLRAWLSTQERDELARIVHEQAATDWRLRERLLARAAAAQGAPVALASWRHRVEAAFDAPDYVPYAEAADWAAGVDTVIDALADLLDEGHAAAVVELAEHAHRRADDAMQYVDDSDGWLSDISARLGALHLDACAAARPDAITLARRLVDLELGSELDAFHRAAGRYADVLGSEGLAEYRRLLAPRFAALPAGDGGFSTERFRVTQAMVGVAHASGDPDELIAVMRGRLRIPDDYAEIAAMLAAADRLDEAVDWAQQGLERFADRPWQTPPLRDLLAGLHRRRGDEAAALGVFWDGFAAAPSLQTYRRLLSEAGREAEALRDRALEHLRAGVAGTGGGPTPPGRARSGASVLVEVLLHEGRADDAWEVAIAHDVDAQLWLALARAREDVDPVGAIRVYEREVADLITRKKAPAYRAAVKLVVRIRRLHEAPGGPADFPAYLAGIRTEHKRKSSLMAMLDRVHRQEAS